jgi:hypothetical protein
MEKCFVIQPFDNNKFDKRYEDVFSPAIVDAGFEPYRVDKDLSVRVPIEDIEKGINESALCFAEITTDNPNVWYELGYAVACEKDIIMVCSDERQGKYPFDIQHRHIISYKTGSTSDFLTLGATITKRIKAIIQKSKTVKTLNTTPILETEGLKSHEIALLILAMENSISKEDTVSVYNLKNEMGKAGYTDIATSVGVRTLTKYGMIETFKAVDEWNKGNEYIACRITDTGEQWILNNQDQIQFRKPQKNNDESNELPF